MRFKIPCNSQDSIWKENMPESSLLEMDHIDLWNTDYYSGRKYICISFESSSSHILSPATAKELYEHLGLLLGYARHEV